MFQVIFLQAGSGLDLNMFMLPLALVVLYFFMIRPQMKRQEIILRKVDLPSYYKIQPSRIWFVECLQGGYVFHLENDAIIDFDQINFKILEEFDLKSNQFKNTTFEIVYSENFDDLDNKNAVLFKLEKLKLL